MLLQKKLDNINNEVFYIFSTFSRIYKRNFLREWLKMNTHLQNDHSGKKLFRYISRIFKDKASEFDYHKQMFLRKMELIIYMYPKYDDDTSCLLTVDMLCRHFIGIKQTLMVWRFQWLKHLTINTRQQRRHTRHYKISKKLYQLRHFSCNSVGCICLNVF